MLDTKATGVFRIMPFQVTHAPWLPSTLNAKKGKPNEKDHDDIGADTFQV